jgi:hypothetical protein
VRTMFMSEHFDLAMASRPIQRAGCALIFFLGATAPTFAQDISSVKSMLAAKQCPPSEYSRIRYDDRNCGYPAQKACDDRYRAPSQPWQECYDQLNLCRKQADADNQVINEANRVYRDCQQRKSDADYSNQKTSSTSQGGGSESGSDLARRLASQTAKNTTAGDVRLQQDRRFSNAVESAKQESRVTKCRSDYDQGVATCNGNTGQFRKENFVASWVDLESRTCMSAASRQERLCEAIARREPQSNIDALTQASAESDNLHERISNSYGDWLPQNVGVDPGPSYAPNYHVPSQTYQSQPQQSQTYQSRLSQPNNIAPGGPCLGDSTVCSGGGSSAPRPYIPPPQPQFVAPRAVR